MIYTDEENLDWWAHLSEYEREDIIGVVIENSELLRQFAESLKMQWKTKRSLSPKQISSLRRWVK